MPEAETIASIGAALKPVAEKWTEKLGVDVDFAVKTPWRLKHDEERIMVQELVRGYFDVEGKKGEVLFTGIARVDAAKLPWMEAARLLMNRGMGLLFAKCKVESVTCKVEGSSAVESRLSAGDRDFVARNINKCILGAGDARLIARRAYKWRAQERAEAVRDDIYTAAVDWKFRPREESVCDWETARMVWRGAYDEVREAGAGELGRSLREAARWVVRRRSVGMPQSFGQNCTVRVLKCVARCLESRSPIPPSLRRDWAIFN